MSVALQPLLVPLLAAALQAAPGSAGAPGTGTLEGRIVSAEDATPVPGARVAVDSLAARVRSDASGAYRLDAVPAGRWTVRVDAPGFDEHVVVVRVPAAGRLTLDFELTLARTDGSRAERTGRLTGIVREEGRLEPVRFATVEVDGFTIRAVSDEHGLFSLSRVPAGEHRVTLRAPGYGERSVVVGVLPSSAVQITVELPRDPVVLPEVRVAGTRSVGLPHIEAPEAVVLDSAFLDLVPTVVERDVFRALQALPSATPSSDYSAAPFVRGGTPDQTRIFLDGAPIYNPFHVGGFASAFAPTAVATTVLRPGGLPASAPSALSGLLEVQARDGGRDSVRVAGSLGLLSTHATVDGPLREGRGAFLLSARRTYVDVATDAASGLGLIEEGIPYGFYDLHGKLTHDVGPVGALSLTAYLNRESFDTDSYDGRAGWGNDLVSARFAGFVTDGTLAELGAGTSAFGGSYTRPLTVDPFGNRQEETRMDAGFRTWFVDGRLTRRAGAHTLWAGGRWERTRYAHAFDPAATDDDWVAPLDVDGSFGALALYARDLWSIGGPLALDWGVRLERPRRRAWYALPRGRITAALGSGSLAVGGGRYVQDVWSLRNEESVLASVAGYDLPVSVPAGRPLQRGWDAVLEGRWSWAGWRFRSDVYVKRLTGVPSAPPLSDPIEAPLIEHPDSVDSGELDVEGLEVSAAGRLGGTTVSLAYRWQRETRTLHGRSFTPRTSRPHRVVALASRRFGERKAALSVTWMSGLRFTPPWMIVPRLGGTTVGGRLRPGPEFRQAAIVLAEPNSAALPSYLRIDLDLRGAWDWTLFGRDGVIEPYVSVLNLLNNRNVLFSEHELRHARTGLTRTFGPQLPVLPTLGLRWRF